MFPGLQFAVVREDPAVEAAMMADGAHALLIASGGCTALSLQARYPAARFTLIDPNPAQHAHIHERIAALKAGQHHLFNLTNDDPDGLSERGNFEALFRQFRSFLHTFVTSPAQLHVAAQGDAAAVQRVLQSPYWSVAFDLFFSDALLQTMFGPAAVQHAVPGSYPRYFQAAVERGMARSTPNPFLHHILCGDYSPTRPDFLRRPPQALRFTHVLGTLDVITDFSEFDLVHLSNILDWTAPDAARALGHRIAASMRPGAALTLRQLNNTQPIETFFPGVRFDLAQSAALTASDRSLFYNRILVGRRE